MKKLLFVILIFISSFLTSYKGMCQFTQIPIYVRMSGPGALQDIILDFTTYQLGTTTSYYWPYFGWNLTTVMGGQLYDYLSPSTIPTGVSTGYTVTFNPGTSYFVFKNPSLSQTMYFGCVISFNGVANIEPIYITSAAVPGGNVTVPVSTSQLHSKTFTSMLDPTGAQASINIVGFSSYESTIY